MSTKVVVGVYDHLDGLLEAIKQVKSGPEPEFKVYSPVPNHSIENALKFDENRSWVRYFSLFGTSLGVTGGFFAAFYSSLKWGLFIGGKPPGSFQPFVVIGFEMFVLFGALCTLLGVFLLSRVFWREDDFGFDPRFTQDRFGMSIRCAEGDSAKFEKMLKDSGAEEVRIEEGEKDELI